MRSGARGVGGTQIVSGEGREDKDKRERPEKWSSTEGLEGEKEMKREEWPMLIMLREEEVRLLP